MLKTITIGKKIGESAQATKIAVMSGDRIVLIDSATGKPPQKVVTKIFNKDLFIYEEGATEPSAILADYGSFRNTVQISGTGESGVYVNYGMQEGGIMELGAAPIATPVASEPLLSSNAMWGVGILAVAGGIAAAAGGGGGGGGTAAAPSTSTTLTAYLIDSPVANVSYTTSSGGSGTTGADGSFSYKTGDTITFKVGKVVLGVIDSSALPTDGKLLPQDLVGVSRADTSDPRVINIARFLQTLDTDTNPDTITISSNEITALNNLTSPVNLQYASASDITAIQNALGTTLIDASTAIANLTDQTAIQTAPTASITLSDTILNKGESATVTIAFTEPVIGFSNSDVTVQNGTLGTLSTLDGGKTWTATFTPTVSTSDSTNVITLGSTYTDLNGQQGTGAVSANYAVNTIVVPAANAPTVTITDNVSGSANLATSVITYTFLFSEAVSGFTVDDVSVTNGIKGQFSQITSTTFTLEVTPATDGTVIVNIPSGAATGTTSGLGNDAAYTSYQAVDLTAPAVSSVTLSDTNLTPGDTSVVTIRFSEAVTNFSNSDIDLTGANGALGTLTSADNITWTGLFTPTANINNDTSNVIRVLNTYSDMAGNSGSIGASSDFTVNTANATATSDTVKPKITINDDEDSITANMDGRNADGTTDANGGDILYTFTFDEAVKNFTIDDITVKMQKTDGTTDSTYTALTDPNGLIFKTFTKVSDSVYTLAVHPAVGYTGVMKVGVDGSDLTDLVGNALDTSNLSALSSLQAVDMHAPFMTAPILADPEYQRLILTFNEPLEQVSNNSIGSNFAVRINHQDFTVVDASVSEVGGTTTNQLSLYLDPITNARGELFDWSTAGITVSYTHPSGDNTPGVQDLAGNDPWSFRDYLDDTLAPNAKITMSDTVISSGNTSTVTFAFSEKVTLSLDDLDLTQAHGTMDTLTSTDGGATWTSIFTPTIGIEDITNIITLNNTYSDQAGNTGIADNSGNYTIDTKAPIFVSAVASNDDDTITLTFDEVLDAANHASGTDFYVTDGSTSVDTNGNIIINRIDVLGIGISGNTMTLSMKPMVAGDWKVIYTDINGDTQYAIQDIYGSDTTGFSWTAPVL